MLLFCQSSIFAVLCPLICGSFQCGISLFSCKQVSKEGCCVLYAIHITIYILCFLFIGFAGRFFFCLFIGWSILFWLLGILDHRIRFTDYQFRHILKEDTCNGLWLSKVNQQGSVFLTLCVPEIAADNVVMANQHLFFCAFCRNVAQKVNCFYLIGKGLVVCRADGISKCEIGTFGNKCIWFIVL